jgi:aryl sulfotransferase
VFKGTNGRWKDVLSADDLALYEAAMKKTLPPDCAHWLEVGGAYARESASELAS